ncbi:MAG: 16S rRNA (uracil(1498)-N(3))-methyltransferase [Proteobacteria bacterium]|nr:16S rRNA (uracil(1498)-N(3))-methyltransferase [Pseudomonadota bacterium]
MACFWLEDLSVEDPVLARDQDRHLALVRRVRPGDRLDLTDGQGALRPTRVVRVERGRVQLAWDGPAQRVPRPPEAALAAALVRGPRFDEIVRAAAELGFSTVIPFACHRTRADRAGDSRLRRWQKLAQETGKQTGRPWFTEVHGPQPWPRTLELSRTFDGRILLYEGPAEIDLDRALEGLDADQSVVLMVGPEGGFIDQEVAQAREAGFKTAGLGPTIFRTETAARIAATLVWNARGRP